MVTQPSPSGRVHVTYGAPVGYQSPLWIISSCDTEVVYADHYQGPAVARVYRKGDEWYLSCVYLEHWQPIETFSKYEGFLLLLNIFKRQRQ
jgi:hypothetical protein